MWARADIFSIGALVCKRHLWNLKFWSFRAHKQICHATWKIHFMTKKLDIMCICGRKFYCRNETNSFREKIYACYETAPQRIKTIKLLMENSIFHAIKISTRISLAKFNVRRCLDFPPAYIRKTHSSYLTWT
jgi:uncharacterized protein YerC